MALVQILLIIARVINFAFVLLAISLMIRTTRNKVDMQPVTPKASLGVQVTRGAGWTAVVLGTLLILIGIGDGFFCQQLNPTIDASGCAAAPFAFMLFFFPGIFLAILGSIGLGLAAYFSRK